MTGDSSILQDCYGGDSSAPTQDSMTRKFDARGAPKRPRPGQQQQQQQQQQVLQMSPMRAPTPMSAEPPSPPPPFEARENRLPLPQTRWVAIGAQKQPKHRAGDGSNSHNNTSNDGLMRPASGYLKLESSSGSCSVLRPPRAMARRQLDIAEALAAVTTIPPQPDGKSSFAQSVFNLANILMGVGMLGLPFALRSAGWVGGLGCLFVFGLVCWRTAILIGRELNGDPRPSHIFYEPGYKTPLLLMLPLPPPTTPSPQQLPRSSSSASSSARRDANALPTAAPGARGGGAVRMLEPTRNFPDIARAAFGEAGCVAWSSILYFELFSCVCIFFVTIGDHLHVLFPNVSAATHVLVVGAITVLPTMLLKTTALLSYLSVIGMFATIAVVAAVVASAVSEGDLSPTELDESGEVIPSHVLFNDAGLAMAFGLVAYCFSGHAIVPAIYTSMREPQRFESMVTCTFLIVVSLCAAVGASGYYMFGSGVLDQVTISLDERSTKAVGVMKVLTWLMVMTGTLLLKSLCGSCDFGLALTYISCRS
jgi:amino acid permease